MRRNNHGLSTDAQYHKGVWQRGGQRPCEPGRGTGRDPCPVRRKRRGKKHADERAVWDVRQLPGQHPAGRQAPAHPQPQGRHRQWDRHGTPALYAGKRPQCGGKRDPRPARRPGVGYKRGGGADQRPGKQAGDRNRSLCPGGRSDRGATAAGGDHQGVIPGCEDPDPGRTHRGFDAGGSGQPIRFAAQADPSGHDRDPH